MLERLCKRLLLSRISRSRPRMNRHQRLQMRRVAGDDGGLHFQSLGGDQDIGVQRRRIGGWFTLASRHCPECGGPFPCGGRYRQVGENSIQLIEAIQSRRWELASLNEPRQFSAEFVVGDLRQVNRGPTGELLQEPRLNWLAYRLAIMSQ